jgi:hypothetical protein
MILPTKKEEAKATSPYSLIIYGPPKIGKTEALAQLENFLLIDFEDGSNHVDAMKIKVNNFEELTELGKEVVKAGKPYAGMIYDTVTELEDWCEWDATETYMNTIMGKGFNSRAGVKLPRNQWESVLTLPRGAGYLWHRSSFKKWKSKLDTLATYKIYVAHIKDIFLEKEDETVSAKDLDLTGKIKNIACGQVDAIGYVYRDPKNPLELRISFKNNDLDVAGSRAKHLRNQDFVLVENNPDGSVKQHFWNKIYIHE